MAKDTQRDDFNPKTVETIAKRAAYICSNPVCHLQTLSPSKTEPDKAIYNGVAAHITAAAPGGPRYEPALTREQRSSVQNGIFLCPTCASMIDKNQGADYPVGLLEQWNQEHTDWLAANPHMNLLKTSGVTVVDGVHCAKGIGDVTGLDVQGPAIFRPGTKSTAEGSGTITATRIGSHRETE